MPSLPVVPLHHEPTDVLLAHGVHCRYSIRFQATKQTLHRCVVLSGCAPLCHAKITLDDYWEAALRRRSLWRRTRSCPQDFRFGMAGQHHFGLLSEPDPQTSVATGLDGEP